MNGSQSDDGNVPEEKEEKQENDTGKDQQSNEDSLFGPNLQRRPRNPLRNEVPKPVS